ncbi:MAG TPA: heme-binding domain-containing protein, partial [Anaerolineae bacterium]|nr:heme-binding domain-containing protein [Anaerolineae bacterium]
EVQWDSTQTRDLVTRACYDCHSNQTTWPWYSNIAPISWLIQHDVEEGRSRLNFTAGNRREAENVARLVQSGQMPQWYYVFLHSTANLTSAEKQALVQGLQTSLSGGGQTQ